MHREDGAAALVINKSGVSKGGINRDQYTLGAIPERRAGPRADPHAPCEAREPSSTAAVAARAAGIGRARTVAGRRQLGHDGELHEVGQAEVAHDARAGARAEGAVAHAVGAVEVGHVLGDRGAGHGHAREHADALGHVHKGQLLRRSHDDGRGELDGLRARRPGF